MDSLAKVLNTGHLSVLYRRTCRRLYLMTVETERLERFKQHVWKLKDWSVSNNTCGN